MSSGLFALLDDIAVIAKTAAVSLDDVAAQTMTAGKSAAGIVIDDAAVTPRYVDGLAAKRELPIVARIAWGSIKNKLLYLLPAALALSTFAPWAITPLLMIGGLYLCLEGYEKVHELIAPAEPEVVAAVTVPAGDARAIEDKKVSGAIRTDFILSAEIMAISLASVTASNFVTKALVLASVGILITVLVYGAVALIVKADDFGLFLAQKAKTQVVRSFGRWLVGAMPSLLAILSFIGMLAMLWVGGGIVLHGLSEFGLGAVSNATHGFAQGAGALVPAIAGFITWFIDAAIAGIIGLALGWLTERGVHAAQALRQ